MKVYLDNAATTPVHPKVLEKMLPFLKESFGNPSSIHSFGRSVRVAIEEARENVADFINADASEIYFTSSGTEALNFAILGMSRTIRDENGKSKIVTGANEHYAVIESFKALDKEGFDTHFIDSKYNGEIDYDELKENSEGAALISVMHVNNVLGSINNLSSVRKLAGESNAFFHTDAVQSFGKIKIDVNEIGCHALCASGHKLNGPKGIGMAYIKSETPIAPMMLGGSQERSRRGGTENVAGIIGFSEAVNLIRENIDYKFDYASKLKNRLITGLRSIDKAGIIINCLDNSTPHICSVTLSEEYYNNDAEAMLMYLDINGVAVSGGAACTSGTLKPSHAVLAIGHSKNNAAGTFRFSFGAQNRDEEIDYTLEVLKKMTDKFRK
ncbi:MAG: cysteine desulfurase [Ignavibacteriae bacterium]|nr:cysteine desulfurase [Ignavibacteriota bacterium]NOG99602.1 cysteine desulfurase [Ignavibacteriota bacterium]